MKAGAFSILLVFCSGLVDAQPYAVSAIPDSLRNGVNQVLRKDVNEFTIHSPSHGSEKISLVRTIFNEKAKRGSRLVVGYDDLKSLDRISAKVYDANGILLETYKERDFDDIAAYDGVSIYTDNRLKVLNIRSNNYPFTVEFEYERSFVGLMFYPSNVFNSISESVESAVFKVNIVNGMNFRYKCFNVDEPKVERGDSHTTYLWKVSNQKKLEREPYGPAIEEMQSKVITGPKSFVFGNYIGDMSTWEELGEFQRKLYSDLEELPESKKAYIRSLTKEYNSIEDKIRIVYDYLQNNFRYVSVQLGVGGWRPFSPLFVDENGYGDCKALSFYTKSLLETIDIESHYTLVSAGRNFSPLDKNFPSPNFNHAILCVPNQGDTIWLECTSQTSPIGYNGSFTGGRDVFVITDNSAAIVKTKSYDQSDNTQYRMANVQIDDSGNSAIKVSTEYRGLQYENDNLNFAIHYGADKQEEWLYKNIGISDFEIVDFEITNIPSAKPEATISANITARGFASSSGKRIFFTPNILNKRFSVPKEIEDRETDVILKMSYIDVDSIWFSMPEQMSPEFLPETVSLEEEFGSYKAEVINQEGTILYVRTMRIKKGRYAPETYDRLRTFYREVVKADKTKVVFRKET